MRPIRQIVALLAALIVWVIYSIFHSDFGMLGSWAALQKRLGEQPVWVFFLFFILMVLAAADQLQKTKSTAASLWGGEGIERFFEVPQKLSIGWLLVAVVSTGAGLGMAGSLNRYYFTQDDNFSQFLPGMLAGCRAVWEGHFANWNPYQMLGAPLGDVGTYALTYPFTYLSYALARGIFHDERLVLDVFCWLHLLMASAITFLLARAVRLWGPVAAAVAVCYSLSGYALIAGRSWYYMTPTMFWFPLLVWLAVSFSPMGRTGIWTICAGLAIGLFYHSGNVQMWVYGVGFFAGLLLLRRVREGWTWRELAELIPALLLGVGLAIPLLLPQWKATTGLERSGGGDGIEFGLMSMLYPNPLVNSGMPNGWGNDNSTPEGQLYYAGTFFTLAWVAGIAVLVAGKEGLKAIRGNPLLICSLVAFLFALGSKGVLWLLHMQLPLLRSFTHPFKFLPFLHLFSLILGGLILQRAFARSSKQAVAGISFFAVAAVVMFYHASISNQAFYLWNDRPDARIPGAMRLAIGGERIYPLAPARSPIGGYYKSLAHNFASFEQVQSIEGYEPLWRNKLPYSEVNNGILANLPEILRRYGVTRLVVLRTAGEPVLSPNKGVNGNEQLPLEWVKQALKVADGEAIYKDESVAVHKVAGSDPLARNEQNGVALPLAVIGNEVVVNTALMGGGGKIMVNYLWRPGIVARAGGRALMVSADRYSRLEIVVPAETARVFIGYEAPWGLGIATGAAVMLAGVLLGWKLRFKG